jgi:hypothetical protein
MLLRIPSVARIALLEESPERFCKERSAVTLSMSIVDSAAATRVSNRPSYRVKKLVLGGNLVRFKIISRDLEWTGFSFSLETTMRESTSVAFEQSRLCNEMREINR